MGFGSILGGLFSYSPTSLTASLHDIPVNNNFKIQSLQFHLPQIELPQVSLPPYVTYFLNVVALCSSMVIIGLILSLLASPVGAIFSFLVQSMLVGLGLCCMARIGTLMMNLIPVVISPNSFLWRESFHEWLNVSILKRLRNIIPPPGYIEEMHGAEQETDRIVYDKAFEREFERYIAQVSDSIRSNKLKKTC